MTGWDVAYLCLAICFGLVVAIHTIIWSRIYANRLNDLRQTKYKFDKEYEYLKEYEKKHEKDFEILEIIKKKKVNVALLLHLISYNPRPLQKYNEVMLNEWNDLYLLTQEEFDLLKEELCHKD